MANLYGPRIVTDGLVLHLDAANRKSYPGTGTSWNDLSGNGNNSTLINGPAYNTNKRGYITFDGSNDYADFYAPNLGSITTVESFAYLDSSILRMFMWWQYYDVYMSSGRLGYNTGNSDVYGLSASAVSSLGAFNNWTHYVFEMVAYPASYTSNKIYINGVSQTLSQQLGSENSGGKNFNSGNGRISGWRANTNYPTTMNVASFRIYNRALSQSEITNNYNALKGRFAL